jgi:3-hydroxyacyl-CoA dehydrogenase
MAEARDLGCCKGETIREVASMEVETIAVAGAGTMGHGIAQVAAMGALMVRLGRKTGRGVYDYS